MAAIAVGTRVEGDGWVNWSGLATLLSDVDAIGGTLPVALRFFFPDNA
jgi:hypothetical protein